MRGLKNRLIASLLIALSLLMVIGQVSALQTLTIERPDEHAQIDQSLSSSNMQGEAGVSLGAYAFQNSPWTGSPWGTSNIVNLNVSMAANTRVGVSYRSDGSLAINDKDQSWKWTPQGVSTLVNSYTNLQNDSGFWIDLPQAYGDWEGTNASWTFMFYGVKYQNWTGYPIASHIWVCTNGFISLDPSALNVSSPSAFPSNVTEP